jgi:hypothetical protein
LTPVQSELLRHFFQLEVTLLVLAIHFVAKRLLLAIRRRRSSLAIHDRIQSMLSTCSLGSQAGCLLADLGSHAAPLLGCSGFPAHPAALVGSLA